MASLVQEIAKQAQITFSKTATDESFPGSLSELIKLISGLQDSDLNINLETEQVDSSAESPAKGSEPVTCILIDENELFTMGMFLMKNGSKIPLHDHPQMHGIIKVILGTIKMTTFSPVINQDDLTEIPEDVKNRSMSHPTDSLVPVEQHMCKNVTNNDEPVLVTPTVGNYHEMCAVEGPAVIFDLIGPPYDMITRNCNYYSILESKDSNVQCKTWLYGIPEASEYWCVSAKYTGPIVSL